MRRRDNGYVLVSVLWVVALLTVVTMSYHHRARLEVQAARYALDASQCRMAARGAVERAIVEIRNKQLHDTIAAMTGGEAVAPVTHLGQPWAREQNLYEVDGLLAMEEDFADDVARFSIEDTERYVNINAASDALLAALPGFTRPVLRRINYQRYGRDETGESTEIGAVLFHDPAEIRYVRGLDDEAWYGDGEAPGLRDVLTTFGDGRVNINTAPAAVLRVLPELGDTGAEDILAWRSGADGEPETADDRGFATWDEVEAATGIGSDTLQALKQHCKFDSNFFRITALATRRGGRIRASCSAVIHLPSGASAANLISWTEDALGSQ